MPTVAEKDTAAAANCKPRWGRPKAAVGRQRAAHRLRLAAAAQPRPPICLKIDSPAHEWLTWLLSRTHAQAARLSVCLCHRPHDMHRHLGTVDYNGDKIQEPDSASFGFDWYWLQGLKCLLVTPTNCVLSAHARARSTDLSDHAHRNVSVRFRSLLSTRMITTDKERMVYVT